MSVDSPDWAFTAPLGTQINNALNFGTQDTIPVPAAGCYLFQIGVTGNAQAQFGVTADGVTFAQLDSFKIGPPLSLGAKAGVGSGNYLVPVPAGVNFVIKAVGPNGQVSYNAVFLAGSIPLMLLGQQVMASSQPMAIASDQSAVKTVLTADGAVPDGGALSTVLALAAYTATQDVILQNKTHRGLFVLVNVTVAGTGSLTPGVRLNDAFATGAFYWKAAAAIAGTGVFAYLLLPGGSLPTAHGSLVEVAQVNFLDGSQLEITKSDASSWTFGVEAQLVN